MILVLFRPKVLSKVTVKKIDGKRDEIISLSEGKIFSGGFAIDWTKTFEGMKIPQRKQDCLHCDNGKYCSDFVMKAKMNCFTCEIERTGKSCLDQISQKKYFLLILIS